LDEYYRFCQGGWATDQGEAIKQKERGRSTLMRR
jgi:hypothetical protein